MKKLTLVAVIAFTLGGAAVALSAPAVWRVIATGNDASTYGAFANASADAQPSQALAVRATSSPGKPVKVTFFVSCQGERTMQSGQVLVVSVATSRKCSLEGSANTGYSGRVKVELLRR